MDYTKVISTVKKYAFAIADELNVVSNDIIGELDTLYSKVKQETDAIKTDVGGVKSDVAGVRGGVDTTLQGVTELISKGTVKSVQRGVVQWASTAKLCGKEVTVNLAQVNPSKTIVLLQASHGKLDSDGNYVAQASLASISATSMQLNVTVFCNAYPTNSTIYASWKVVEFY